MDLWLNDTWSLYFHDPYNDNWSHSGYVKLFTLGNINEFWVMYKCIENILHEGMFFVMRDHIFPKWNDAENKDGGFLSIKILKEKINMFCEHLFKNLVNETLLKTDFYEHASIVNGISISPKKHFCIVKIWLKNCDIQDSTNFNIPNEYHGDIIFKTNTCKV